MGVSQQKEPASLNRSDVERCQLVRLEDAAEVYSFRVLNPRFAVRKRLASVKTSFQWCGRVPQGPAGKPTLFRQVP